MKKYCRAQQLLTLFLYLEVRAKALLTVDELTSKNANNTALIDSLQIP